MSPALRPGRPSLQLSGPKQGTQASIRRTRPILSELSSHLLQEAIYRALFLENYLLMVLPSRHLNFCLLELRVESLTSFLPPRCPSPELAASPARDPSGSPAVAQKYSPNECLHACGCPIIASTEIYRIHVMRALG